MANFPIGIRCSSITPTPGTFPGIDHITIAGNIRSYQGGNRITNGTITLSFNSISSAIVATLRAHWDGEQTYGTWQLSSDLLDGLEYATEYSSRQWQYSGPYRITDYTSESGGVHDAVVDLRQVPVFEFIDPLIIRPQTAYLRLGSSIRLVGPGDLPDLWTSRLTTEQRTSTFGGSYGSIMSGPNGTNFQVFWFEPTTGTFPNQQIRVVVVKRDVQGVILWQVWTSAEWGNIVTSRDNTIPQVLPLSDGGCAVFAITDGPPSNNGTILIMRVWRISSTGTQLWTKEYAGNINGAFRVALSGSQIIVYTNSGLSHISQFRAAPTLLFINLSDGALIAAYSYRINNTSGGLGARARDALFILSSGSIVLKAAQTIFMEVSGDGATVNRVATFSSSGASCLDGGATVLPGGQYLCRNDNSTLVRLAADFSVFATYKYVDAMSAGGNFFGAWTNSLAADSVGNGYHIASKDVNGRELKIVKFASGGSSIIDYEEISFGSNIGNQIFGEVDQGASYGIDLERNRGLFHLTGGSGAACKVTAMGFSLNQTTDGAALDTGTCSNTMGVIGYSPVTYNTATPDIITRTLGSATVSTVALTVSNGSLNMVDSSSALSWTRRALIV